MTPNDPAAHGPVGAGCDDGRNRMGTAAGPPAVSGGQVPGVSTTVSDTPRPDAASVLAVRAA